jgi:hypothetical protein
LVLSTLALLGLDQEYPRLVGETQNEKLTVNTDLCPEDMKWNDILLWLNAFRSPLGSTINKIRAQGTCEWIYTKQPFKEWRSSKTSAGLWIHGRPGELKSKPPVHFL